MISALPVFLCSASLSLVTAQSNFFPEGFSSDNTVSAACSNALSATFACPDYFLFKVNDDDQGPFDNDTAVDQFCSSTCETAIASYISQVTNTCKDDPQPWEGIPAVYPGARLNDYRTRTCLKDPASGEYCSVCSVQYPTDVQPWPLNVTNDIPPGVNSTIGSEEMPCLSGNYYTVASGDDCIKISLAQGVSTGALRLINSLYPDCSNLITGQSICLPNTCQTYTIQPGDTCFSIADSHESTITAIRSFNPTVNSACSNLIADEAICLAPPAGNYTPTAIVGASTTQAGSYATTTVAPPGPTAFGTTPYCGRYYEVVTGDNCGQISINNTVSLSLFQAINPSINQDCTNLIPGFFYCVFPMATWNDTASGNSTTTSSVTQAPPAPTGPGTTGSCYRWHTVQSGDYCALLQSSYGITMAQLQSWNTELRDDCSNLVLGQAYCVNGPSSTGGSSTDAATTSTTTTDAPVSTPTPTQAGMVDHCRKFYQAVDGDYCSLITQNNGISVEDFVAWNPAVGSDCSQIWLGYWYCVGV